MTAYNAAQIRRYERQIILSRFSKSPKIGSVVKNEWSVISITPLLDSYL
jgi:hypothetical protein